MALNATEMGKLMEAVKATAEKTAKAEITKSLAKQLKEATDNMKAVSITLQNAVSLLTTVTGFAANANPLAGPAYSEGETDTEADPTADDVRAALRRVATGRDKDTARKIIEDAGAASVSDLKPSQYAEVIGACSAIIPSDETPF